MQLQGEVSHIHVIQGGFHMLQWWKNKVTMHHFIRLL